MKIIRHSYKNVLIALVCLLLYGNPGAGSFQSLQSIREAAERHIRQQIQLADDQRLVIQVRQLDKRLRLPKCPESLRVSLPSGFQLRSRTSVQVECTAAGSTWKLFVPLHIQKRTRVWAAARSLPRGHILNSSDLQPKMAQLDLDTPVRSADDLVNKRLKQGVSAGQVIDPRWLETPLSIRRGERVTLVADSGRVQVRVAGEALQNARLGEKMKVRNLSSGKTIQGWLTAPGVVRVDNPVIPSLRSQAKHP